MYMSLVSHRVRTFVRVTAASLHMTGIVRINHTEVRSRNHSYRGRAKVLHILCVCVCVCVCVCSFSYRACKAHAPYYIVCGLTSAATFSNIIS